MRKKLKMLITTLLMCVVISAIAVVFAGKLTNSSFLVTSANSVEVSCGSLVDNFFIEIYYGDKEIKPEEIDFNKEYTFKVYNKSGFPVDFYMDTLGTGGDNAAENTFLNYIILYITDDEGNNSLGETTQLLPSDPLKYTEGRKKIEVKNFKSSDEPMIFKLKFSTDILKNVATNAPSKIKHDKFNLKLTFFANSTKEE